jgi:integrase
LVDDYLMACRARGLSRATITGSYGYPLQRIFLPWCHARGVTEAAQLNTRVMDAFSVHLLEDGGKDGRALAKTSVHAYVRAVRGFAQWCEREGEGKLARPALPKLPRRVLDVLDRDEIAALEAGAQSERDRIIIRILGDCGLRAEEVCSLRPESIIRRDRQSHLSVRGKGERDRLVPCPPALLRRIESYIRVARPTETRGPELFLSLRRGKSGDYEALTPSGILQLVARAAYQAGIKKRVYTHLLRHSFITNALRSGMSPILVAKIAGHSSLRMIERVYSHLTTDDAYDAMMEMLAKQGH